MVLYCTCNRTGSCRGCACVKARKECSNCLLLPSKLGSCSNISSTPIPSTVTHTVNQLATNTTLHPTLALNSSSASCGSATRALNATSESGVTVWCSRYFSYFHSANELYFKPTMSTAAPDLPTNEHTCIFLGDLLC